MRAADFILENDNDPRSQNHDSLSFEQVYALLKTNCSEALKAFSTGHQIYKGLQLTGNFYKTDPSLIERASANTYNYYTILFSNLPNWKAYPKRSRSLICSTSYQKAKSYAAGNNPFLVMPFDGARIGICPTEDIWTSSMTPYIIH